MLITPSQPSFQKTVKFENKYLDSYLQHSARKFEHPDSVLPVKYSIYPICELPGKEALQKAREKYEADKARYLVTGELPKDE